MQYRLYAGGRIGQGCPLFHNMSHDDLALLVYAPHSARADKHALKPLQRPSTPTI